MATTAKQYARSLRIARKIHRTLGIFLFFVFVLIATSGLLLGWKKHSGGLILPKSHQGVSTDSADWLSIHELKERAFAVAHEQLDPTLSLELERIDLRPHNGMVKFVFIEDYWGIQLDCTTGDVLHIERRRSDFIENIHDGSILDYLAGIRGEYVKLVYTTIGGLALLTFSLTGFWLWVGPKRLRAVRRAERDPAARTQPEAEG